MDAIAGALPAQRRDRRALALSILAISTVAVTLLLRVLAARGQPLTMDETFTGMITSQGNLADFIREARRDVAAPLYYTILWLLPLGSSDFALRLPSWTFMILGSALPLFWRIPNQPRNAAIAWAAMLYLWLPGAIFAVQARPYALLFFLATAQTIAFAGLVDTPTLRRSFVWTACTCLTLLTHYFAAPLALAQGLVLVATLRRRALPLWPSLLLVLIPVVETITHFRLLMSFASGDANWLPVITTANVQKYLMFGLGALGPVLLIISLVSRYLDRANAEPMPRGAALASLAGAIALIMLIALGWHRSLLVDHYLTACAPALMLGLVTIATGIGARILLVAVSAGLAIYAAGFAPLRIGEQSMEWAANQLIPLHPASVVYSLGYTGQHTLVEETRGELGSYLFRRAGLATKARMVTVLDGRELVRAAGTKSAIIWVFFPQWQPVADAIARQRHCFVAPHQLACPALQP